VIVRGLGHQHDNIETPKGFGGGYMM